MPATLTTAAGRTVDIDYERDNPTVSVRVQDMFGTLTHPTIADGDPPDHRAVVTGGPPDPDHQRPSRVLVGLVGDGPQGTRRAIPETPMADRSGGRGAEAAEGSPGRLTGRSEATQSAARDVPAAMYLM